MAEEAFQFTPIKSAQRSLADAPDFWVSPAALVLEQMEESPLLADIKVSADMELEKIKQLVEAAREVVIKEEEGGGKAVPLGLEFMMQEPTTGDEAYSQLTQLLEAAKVVQTEDMGFPRRNGRGHANKCVFMRSLASRAVDMAVITKARGSGLADEPAGAVIRAGFEDAKVDPAFVVAFFKKHPYNT